MHSTFRFSSAFKQPICTKMCGCNILQITCLLEITDGKSTALTEDLDILQIRKKLSVCIPELVIDLVAYPILCSSCVTSLCSAYDFKTRCLLTEEHIQHHIQIMDLKDKTFTLEEIYSSLKQSTLPNLNKLSDSPNALVDDLNSLLDGALQNQLEVLNMQKKSQDSVRNKDRLEIQNNIIKEEYISSSGDEFEDELNEDQQNENSNVSFVQNRKLSNKPVNSLISKNINESNKSIFKCSECDYSNPRKKNVAKHSKKVHTSERPFACNLCNYRARCKRFLNSHIKKTHLQPFKCDLCNYTTERKDHFQKHILTHNLTKTKTVCCTICSYKGTTKDYLRRHMRVHKKTFTCNVCEKSFQHKSLLTQHMSMHMGEKPFGCNLCQFKTIYKSNLAKHMQTHAKNFFTCSICNFRTLYKKYLRQHMLIHSGEKPFACNECDYQTANKDRLKEHARTHTGEKPHICQICKASFTHRTNLRRHKKLHEKQPGSICTICGYNCKSEFILKAHIRTHNAKNILRCSTCKYICIQKCLLESHVKVHLKDK